MSPRSLFLNTIWLAAGANAGPSVLAPRVVLNVYALSPAVGQLGRLPKRSRSSAARIMALIGVSISVPVGIELVPGSGVLGIRQTVRFDGRRSVVAVVGALSECGMMWAAYGLIPICWIRRPVRLRSWSMYFRSCVCVTTQRFLSRARHSLRRSCSRAGVPCAGPGGGSGELRDGAGTTSLSFQRDEESIEEFSSEDGEDPVDLVSLTLGERWPLARTRENPPQRTFFGIVVVLGGNMPSSAIRTIFTWPSAVGL